MVAGKAKKTQLSDVKAFQKSKKQKAPRGFWGFKSPPKKHLGFKHQALLGFHNGRCLASHRKHRTRETRKRSRQDSDSPQESTSRKLPRVVRTQTKGATPSTKTSCTKKQLEKYAQSYKTASLGLTANVH